LKRKGGRKGREKVDLCGGGGGQDRRQVMEWETEERGKGVRYGSDERRDWKEQRLKRTGGGREQSRMKVNKGMGQKRSE
jgi:hypothetical protein